MLNFLGFGRSDAEKDEAAKATTPPPTSAVPAQSNDKLREMVRLALTGVLRRHGIASNSLGCEVIPWNAPGHRDVTLVQIVLLKWHDGLVQYGPGLQQEFFDEIHLFDKNKVVDDFLFVWRFASDCGYPHGKLPGPGYWDQSPEARAAAQQPHATAAMYVAPTPAPVPAPAPAKFDLPTSQFDNDDDSGFAATQIHDDGH